jgi:hypothetical protein
MLGLIGPNMIQSTQADSPSSSDEHKRTCEHSSIETYFVGFFLLLSLYLLSCYNGFFCLLNGYNEILNCGSIHCCLPCRQMLWTSNWQSICLHQSHTLNLNGYMGSILLSHLIGVWDIGKRAVLLRTVCIQLHLASATHYISLFSN